MLDEGVEIHGGWNDLRQKRKWKWSKGKSKQVKNNRVDAYVTMRARLGLTFLHSFHPWRKLGSVWFVRRRLGCSSVQWMSEREWVEWGGLMQVIGETWPRQDKNTRGLFEGPWSNLAHIISSHHNHHKAFSTWAYSSRKLHNSSRICNMKEWGKTERERENLHESNAISLKKQN